MKMYLLAFCLLPAATVLSQNVVDVNRENHRIGASDMYSVAGAPFVNTKYVSLVEGSPYFKDEWLKGVIVLDNGKEFKDFTVRLNLEQNEIQYKDEKGAEMVVTSPVKELVITDASGENYKFVHSSALPKTASPVKEGWYLWLCSGAAGLYKSFTKTLTEQRPYNSATTEQRIKTAETYLVLYNNTFMEIKKLKEAPAVLANKKTELEEFLNSKDNKKASMDDRFTALVEYYNSLFPQEK